MRVNGHWPILFIRSFYLLPMHCSILKILFKFYLRAVPYPLRRSVVFSSRTSSKDLRLYQQQPYEDVDLSTSVRLSTKLDSSSFIFNSTSFGCMDETGQVKPQYQSFPRLTFDIRYLQFLLFRVRAFHCFLGSQ